MSNQYGRMEHEWLLEIIYADLSPRRQLASISFYPCRPTPRWSFGVDSFKFARDPRVSGIDSHKPASVLISQACLRLNPWQAHGRKPRCSSQGKGKRV